MRIIFFGDSICIGQYVSHHKSWVSMISQRLDGVATILNSSVNGRTTRQALEDMPYHIQGQKTDVLIVQLGMNDCNYWETDRGLPRVSPKAFEANLEEIIDRAYNFEVKNVILHTNHPSGLTTKILKNTNITYEDSNRKYNNIIRNVARKKSVMINDMEKEFLMYEDYFNRFLLDDLLHPNEKGHELYSNVVYPTIIGLI